VGSVIILKKYQDFRARDIQIQYPNTAIFQCLFMRSVSADMALIRWYRM